MAFLVPGEGAFRLAVHPRVEQAMGLGRAARHAVGRAVAGHEIAERGERAGVEPGGSAIRDGRGASGRVSVAAHRRQYGVNTL